MQSRPLFSIVIPVFNEEDNIKFLIASIENALVAYRYELIFVDDFSSDASCEMIKSNANPYTTLIAFEHHRGQSSALASGIKRARGHYIVTMDGDLQNDPSDIPKMLGIIQNEDLDMVIGFRQNRQDPFLKTTPSKIANFIIRMTTQLQIRDSGCALKVMTSKIAKELPLYGELHRFMALNAHLRGARIKEVPVIHHPRIHGASKYGLERTYKVLKDLSQILITHKKAYSKRVRT
ncbi:glycosyltransferase family 2 protein [Flavobacteriaceae bacterium]|nr:glycosyltransferase family 2 protein [Flavobacteriaceae bacterium]